MRDRIKNEPEASGLETFMRIAVVGSGYVGLVAGACFADMGHEVILVDNDQQKLAALKCGQVPIHEKFLPELLQRHRGQKLRFSDDLRQAAKDIRRFLLPWEHRPPIAAMRTSRMWSRWRGKFRERLTGTRSW